MCKLFFPTTCNHTWEFWKVIWFLHARQLPFFFSFWGEMIWMNYPVLRVQHFQSQRAKSVILSFSKHAYITATVPVTVILNLLSQENFWDSQHKKEFMCEFCNRFQPEHTIDCLKYLHCTLYNKRCLRFMGLWISFFNIMNSLTGKWQRFTTVKHSCFLSPPLKTATLQCLSDGGRVAADTTFPGAQSV